MNLVSQCISKSRPEYSKKSVTLPSVLLFMFIFYLFFFFALAIFVYIIKGEKSKE